MKWNIIVEEPMKTKKKVINKPITKETADEIKSLMKRHGIKADQRSKAEIFNEIDTLLESVPNFKYTKEELEIIEKAMKATEDTTDVLMTAEEADKLSLAKMKQS